MPPAAPPPKQSAKVKAIWAKPLSKGLPKIKDIKSSTKKYNIPFKPPQKYLLTFALLPRIKPLIKHERIYVSVIPILSCPEDSLNL